MEWDKLDNSEKSLILELVRSMWVHIRYDDKTTLKDCKMDMDLIYAKLVKIESILDGHSNVPKKINDVFSKYEEE
tara:strand:+ start:254 stop:478 length:225 start_codon:yes stop_codon:yes gene_type:complete